MQDAPREFVAFTSRNRPRLTTDPQRAIQNTRRGHTFGPLKPNRLQAISTPAQVLRLSFRETRLAQRSLQRDCPRLAEAHGC